MVICCMHSCAHGMGLGFFNSLFGRSDMSQEEINALSAQVDSLLQLVAQRTVILTEKKTMFTVVQERIPKITVLLEATAKKLEHSHKLPEEIEAIMLLYRRELNELQELIAQQTAPVESVAQSSSSVESFHQRRRSRSNSLSKMLKDLVP